MGLLVHDRREDVGEVQYGAIRVRSDAIRHAFQPCDGFAGVVSGDRMADRMGEHRRQFVVAEPHPVDERIAGDDLSAGKAVGDGHRLVLDGERERPRHRRARPVHLHHQPLRGGVDAPRRVRRFVNGIGNARSLDVATIDEIGGAQHRRSADLWRRGRRGRGRRCCGGIGRSLGERGIGSRRSRHRVRGQCRTDGEREKCAKCGANAMWRKEISGFHRNRWWIRWPRGGALASRRRRRDSRGYRQSQGP